MSRALLDVTLCGKCTGHNNRAAALVRSMNTGKSPQRDFRAEHPGLETRIGRGWGIFLRRDTRGRSSLIGVKGQEAARQIDFCDWRCGRVARSGPTTATSRSGPVAALAMSCAGPMLVSAHFAYIARRPPTRLREGDPRQPVGRTSG